MISKNYFRRYQTGGQNSLEVPALLSSLGSGILGAASNDNDATSYNAGEILGDAGTSFGGTLLATGNPFLAGGAAVATVGVGLLNRNKARQEQEKIDAHNEEVEKRRTEIRAKNFKDNLNGSFSTGINTNTSSDTAGYFQTGGAKRPGGKLTFTGQGYEVSGNSHDNGGVQVDPSTEMEDGEYVDTKNFKNGDMVFSKYLKMGGRSFADYARDAGRDRSRLQTLSQVQELYAQKLSGEERSPVMMKCGGKKKMQTGGFDQKAMNEYLNRSFGLPSWAPQQDYVNPPARYEDRATRNSVPNNRMISGVPPRDNRPDGPFEVSGMKAADPIGQDTYDIPVRKNMEYLAPLAGTVASMIGNVNAMRTSYPEPRMTSPSYTGQVKLNRIDLSNQDIINSGVAASRYLDRNISGPGKAVAMLANKDAVDTAIRKNNMSEANANTQIGNQEATINAQIRTANAQSEARANEVNSGRGTQRDMLEYEKNVNNMMNLGDKIAQGTKDYFMFKADERVAEGQQIYGEYDRFKIKESLKKDKRYKGLSEQELNLLAAKKYFGREVTEQELNDMNLEISKFKAAKEEKKTGGRKYF